MLLSAAQRGLVGVETQGLVVFGGICGLQKSLVESLESFLQTGSQTKTSWEENFISDQALITAWSEMLQLCLFPGLGFVKGAFPIRRFGII